VKILVVSDLSMYALGNAYIRALRKKSAEVFSFDLAANESKFIRFGKLGRKIHTFWPVEVWKKKANRELAVEYRRIMPDVVLVFGNVEITYGTIAFFRSVGSPRIILFWPDTLLNLNSFQKESASLYDLVATYSSASIEPFLQIGFKKAVFLPFAGDREFLGIGGPSKEFLYDISFAGGWRPEREAALTLIATTFPELKMLIKGTDWERFCKNPILLKNCDPNPVYGKNFGDFIRSSRINLNVIDDTNFPAANMRFFEIPAAGGLELSSACPEMSSYFTNREDILYYNSEKEMIDQIKWVLDNPGEAEKLRKAAIEKIEKEHTYLDRVTELLKKIV
jgi:spore maturation protein CgeB